MFLEPFTGVPKGSKGHFKLIMQISRAIPLHYGGFRGASRHFRVILRNFKGFSELCQVFKGVYGHFKKLTDISGAFQ